MTTNWADYGVPEDWAAQLHRFWFFDHGPSDWFRGGAAFDGAVAAFADWRKALRSLPPELFTANAQQALAAILLFDQLPRNLYRGQAEVFATDPNAIAIAKAMIDQGLDDGLSADERLFAYLPFQHSEDIDDQRESLRLFASLNNPDYMAFAQSHFDIIKQFGRFPHRNAALGRDDHPGEAEAIARGSQW